MIKDRLDLLSGQNKVASHVSEQPPSLYGLQILAKGIPEIE